MKAVVMAGGEGSRLRPLTINRPKPMVAIVNKPCLGHIFDLLKRHRMSEAVVTLQYLANVIQDSFGSGTAVGLPITYSVEESPLGTGGSVRQVLDHLDDTFMVISGDALTDIDLGAVMRFHKEKRAVATLTLYRVPNPLEYGVVITAPDGRVRQFLEKPSWGEVFSDTINTGIYVIEPEALRHFEKGQPFDFSKDLFPQLLSEGAPIYGYIADGYWTDVGNIAEYMRANHDVLQGKVRTEPIGEEIRPGLFVDGDVEIDRTAVIEGRVYIGKGTKIGQHPRIVGPTTIRSYGVVDAYAAIDRSIVWRNSYIGDHAEVHGAIVGRQCSLKSRVMLEDGSVIGDHSVVGEGARVRAGVKVWPDKQIEAGAVLSSSLIWGAQGRRALFGRFGVTGLVNIDLTAQFAARLGAACAEASLGMVKRRREIEEARFKIVVNYSQGTSSLPLPQLLAELGCDVIAINATVSETVGRSFEMFQSQMRELAAITATLRAHFGVSIDAGGEKVFFVDERGRVINDLAFLAIMTKLVIADEAGAMVSVPVYAPQVLERVAEDVGGRVQRTRASAEALMQVAQRDTPALVADGRGGFIWPAFHASFDGLLTVAKLLELLSLAKRPLSAFVDAAPEFHMARLKVDCPWEDKGRVIRLLAEEPRTAATKQVDGVKHVYDGEWVLVLPESDAPRFDVWAEARSEGKAWELVQGYAQRLETLRQGVA